MLDRGEGYVRDQLCNLDTEDELKENKGPLGFFRAFGLFGIPNIDTKPFFPLQFS